MVHEACELGPREFTISGGGEPLLRKDLLLKLIEIIKSNDIRGNLITNGTLIDPDVVHKMIDVGWDEVIFSIQGHSAEVDGRIRGKKGAFDRTLDSVRTLNQAKSKRDKDKPDIRFQVVLTKGNSENLEGYVHLANEVGVDIVNFRLVNERGGILSPVIDDSFQEEIGNCEDLSDRYGIDFRREFSLSGEEGGDEIFCEKPFRELVVFADGRVSPCCDLFDKTDLDEIPEIGDKTLKEIWHGEKFEFFREKFKDSKYPEICGNCLLN